MTEDRSTEGASPQARQPEENERAKLRLGQIVGNLTTPQASGAIAA